MGSNGDSGQPKVKQKKEKKGMACELYLRKSIGREKKKIILPVVRMTRQRPRV